MHDLFPVVRIRNLYFLPNGLRQEGNIVVVSGGADNGIKFFRRPVDKSYGLTLCPCHVRFQMKDTLLHLVYVVRCEGNAAVPHVLRYPVALFGPVLQDERLNAFCTNRVWHDPIQPRGTADEKLIAHAGLPTLCELLYVKRHGSHRMDHRLAPFCRWVFCQHRGDFAARDVSPDYQHPLVFVIVLGSKALRMKNLPGKVFELRI
mmetsp:Transcript_6805/g.13847  ORF Transcript_6805/g.13847 Transcript_6805/m.13847 type:complete len:204 (+) Transcript_6805:557-1168(+)